ncbi:AAA family ATPase, partial [bacterium]|nr:AAA family ATPase [bacterium]
AGFIVISGEIGTGKTTLIKALLQRLDNQTEVASIFNTTVKPEEFLDLVLQEFELEYSGISRTDKLNRLNEFLIGCYGRCLRAVLIVDEAQNLSLETLEEIRLFSNLQTSKEYLLQIVFVGQPELRDKLAHPGLVQLAQRVAVHYHLAPLTEEETSNYIRYRLEVASDKKEIEDLFTDDAIKAIYRHSKGTPRLINILCDSCLVYAFADEIMTIDGEVVEDAVKSQEASGFSALATAGTPFPDKLDTATLKTVSAESFENESLRALGIKVSELQSGLVTLNRLVQENLLSGQKSTSSISQDLTDLELVIERQNSEIERLTEERKDLLKRIDRLTARNSEQETGDQDNKKRKENRVAGNP